MDTAWSHVGKTIRPRMILFVLIRAAFHSNICLIQKNVDDVACNLRA